jgi:Rod binding domain-containing protein
MTPSATPAGFQSLASELRTTAAVTQAKTALTDLKGAHAAAQNFESVFLSEMFKLMFESLPTDGPFGGGSGEAMFRPLLVDEYSKKLAQQGGIGLSAAVQKEMLKLQESQS